MNHKLILDDANGKPVDWSDSVLDVRWVARGLNEPTFTVRFINSPALWEFMTALWNAPSGSDGTTRRVIHAYNGRRREAEYLLTKLSLASGPVYTTQFAVSGSVSETEVGG